MCKAEGSSVRALATRLGFGKLNLFGPPALKINCATVISLYSSCTKVLLLQSLWALFISSTNSWLGINFLFSRSAYCMQFQVFHLRWDFWDFFPCFKKNKNANFNADTCMSQDCFLLKICEVWVLVHWHFEMFGRFQGVQNLSSLGEGVCPRLLPSSFLLHKQFFEDY